MSNQQEVWISSQKHGWEAGVVEEREEHEKGVVLTVRIEGIRLRRVLVKTGEDVLSATAQRSRRWFKAKNTVEENESVVPRDSSLDPSKCNDLIELAVLNEPVILSLLVGRAAKGFIYSRVGGILLAVNPFREMPMLYSENMLVKYRDTTSSVLPPHLYAVANKAYRDMLDGMRGASLYAKTNQSILISGESGSGKTESAKIVMRYLALVSLPNDTNQIGIEDKVLESNPILESWGNARTQRNDNSSRFGKWLELRFDYRGRLMAAGMKTYLLEKVRLVTQSQGERSFHCIYELLFGLEDSKRSHLYLLSRDEYLGRLAERFAFLEKSQQEHRLDGVDDAERYHSVLKAATTSLGVDSRVLDEVYAALLGILFLGNVTFIDDHSQSATEDARAMLADQGAQSSLTKASALLQFSDQELIQNAITRRSLVVTDTGKQEKLHVYVTAEKATAARDACAKAAYAALFNRLVATLNTALKGQKASTKKHAAVIGILDLFGFEVFDTCNSFEQLLINYANERMQKNFNEYVFEAEQREYENEGIDWSFVDFPSNDKVLELLEGTRSSSSSSHSSIGLLKLVDDECIVPSGNDEALATKLYRAFEKNALFEAPSGARSTGQFRIAHYAAHVAYDLDGFVDKNRDLLQPSIEALLAASPLLHYVKRGNADETTQKPGRLLSSSRSNNKSGSSSGSPTLAATKKRLLAAQYTVGYQFKSQLLELSESIRNTNPSYVRCLKPNDEAAPMTFDHIRLIDQLRYSGVLEAVRVARAGYPVRLPHAEFMRRYSRALASHDDHIQRSLKDPAELVNALSFLGLEAVQVGRTKVFLRQANYDALELFLAKSLAKSATRICTAVRGHLAKSQYQPMLRAGRLISTRLAALTRSKRCRFHFSALRKAVTILQQCCRYGRRQQVIAERRRQQILEQVQAEERRKAAAALEAMRQQEEKKRKAEIERIRQEEERIRQLELEREQSRRRELLLAEQKRKDELEKKRQKAAKEEAERKRKEQEEERRRLANSLNKTKRELAEAQAALRSKDQAQRASVEELRRALEDARKAEAEREAELRDLDTKREAGLLSLRAQLAEERRRQDERELLLEREFQQNLEREAEEAKRVLARQQVLEAELAALRSQVVLKSDDDILIDNAKRAEAELQEALALVNGQEDDTHREKRNAEQRAQILAAERNATQQLADRQVSIEHEIAQVRAELVASAAASQQKEPATMRTVSISPTDQRENTFENDDDDFLLQEEMAAVERELEACALDPPPTEGTAEQAEINRELQRVRAELAAAQLKVLDTDHVTHEEVKQYLEMIHDLQEEVETLKSVACLINPSIPEAIHVAPEPLASGPVYPKLNSLAAAGSLLSCSNTSNYDEHYDDAAPSSSSGDPCSIS